MKDIYFYNTLTRKKEKFVPIEAHKARIYNCGPTVYDYVHIGNLFSFTFADVLRRTLEYFGYETTQVMNITDVGHLVSDDDEGVDKMQKGASRTGKTVWEVAEFYTAAYQSDRQKLNLLMPHVQPKATEHIQEMITMIQVLIDKGFAYITPSAIYFDVTKFPTYTQLSGQKLENNKTLSREELVSDPNKRYAFDFRLWQLDQPDHSMQWESPWGKGFPGWHIECSAMSMKYLGETLDIHTGGYDHIPVHHTNEIAQAEASTGKKYVNYWMHNQFLLVDNAKMSKSKGNFYNMSSLEEKGFEPLSLRMLFLQAKYNEQLNFTLASLEAAQSALQSLRKQVRELLEHMSDQEIEEIKSNKLVIENSYQVAFETALSDDLNTAVALASLYKLLRDSNVEIKAKLQQIFDFDRVLGLRLSEIQKMVETDELKELKKAWEKARTQKDWEIADKLRSEISSIEQKNA